MKIIQFFAVVAILTPCLCADEITGVSIESVSSELSTYGRYAVNMINGSGLSGMSHSNSSSQMWQGVDGDITPSVVIDLGGLCNVSSLLIWNFNAADASYSTFFGIKDLDIYVCRDRALSGGSLWTPVVSAILAKAPHPATSAYSTPDTVSFAAAEATYIKLSARTNYITQLGWSGTQWQQANLSGLSEVKIFGQRIDSYAVLKDVAIADFSDEALEWGFRAAENTVNGSGFENGVHTMGWEVCWQATSTQTPHYIVWDLGASCVIDSIKVWNLNAAQAEAWMAARDVVLYASEDNVLYSSVKNVQLQYPPMSSFYSTPDVLDLGRITARYIKMVINTNYGTNPRYTGLSEVQFVGHRPYLSCEQTGQSVLAADVSGPNGICDCKVDLLDFAYFASRYLD